MRIEKKLVEMNVLLLAFTLVDLTASLQMSYILTKTNLSL